jgi:hypothetical protein
MLADSWTVVWRSSSAHLLFFSCLGPSTANCLSYSDSAPRSTPADPDTRQSWFFWVYDVEGSWIQVSCLELSIASFFFFYV